MTDAATNDPHPPAGGPLDLDAFRSNGHQLVEWIADYLAGLEQRPVIEPVEPGEVRAKLPATPPRDPEPFAELLADLDQVVVPGLAHWQHPNWFAFFPAMSSPASILAEFAAAGLGVQGMLWSTSPAVTEIETHVLDWLVDLLGVPTGWKSDGPGGGVIQMSASDSTHLALVLARERCRDRTGAAVESMVVYTSDQAHSSIAKGAAIAGYRHVRQLPVNDQFAVEPGTLETAIAEDLAAGRQPAFVCAAVGTTGTTAIDPVRRFGEICADQHIWLHVDAAYAGSAMLCPEFRHHQDGLETVDSYTFNPHKWMATNFDCSVFWVADRSSLIDTLSVVPPYLRNQASDSGQVIDYRDWHVPLGRRFRALKLWWVLRSFGVEGLQQMIRSHVGWAQELSDWVDRDPRLERFAPTTFALVCFTHVDGDEATDRLAEALHQAGFAVTASTAADRRYLRVSIGSTWTEHRHVEALRQAIDASA
jgi:aromatic-L-amino-acid decarboxylase